MKVLVLGHKGMLGHMVSKLLISKGIEVVTTKCRWPASCFKRTLMEFDGDYIINCIGAIHQRTNQFNINWELPQWLDENVNCKMVHPGTDCEMDDDDYGNSKRVAAEWIKSSSKNTKIIKTSILGPELNTKASLMEWFLSQTGEINGYSECYWNGNTTLTWAKFCLHLMENWDGEDIETILEGEVPSSLNISFITADFQNGGLNISLAGKYTSQLFRYTRTSDGKCFEGPMVFGGEINVWQPIN